MKRIMWMMVLVGVLMVPATSFAADKQIGVYVAPKFVYGFTQMNKIKDGNRAAYEAIVPEGSRSSDGIGSKTDSTFGGSIAIGYDFSKKINVPVRTELEYATFSTAKAKKFENVGGAPNDLEHLWNQKSFQIQTLFLNAYWDIDTGTKFTPYAGAGLGVGFINAKHKSWGFDTNPAGDIVDTFDDTFSKRNTNFAWNIGAGVGYNITNNWTVDVGYRFVSLGSVKSGTDPEAAEFGGQTAEGWLKTKNLYQHQFAIGVRFTF